MKTHKQFIEKTELIIKDADNVKLSPIDEISTENEFKTEISKLEQIKKKYNGVLAIYRSEMNKSDNAELALLRKYREINEKIVDLKLNQKIVDLQLEKFLLFLQDEIKTPEKGSLASLWNNIGYGMRVVREILTPELEEDYQGRPIQKPFFEEIYTELRETIKKQKFYSELNFANSTNFINAVLEKVCGNEENKKIIKKIVSGVGKNSDIIDKFKEQLVIELKDQYRKQGLKQKAKEYYNEALSGYRILYDNANNRPAKKKYEKKIEETLQWNLNELSNNLKSKFGNISIIDPIVNDLIKKHKYSIHYLTIEGFDSLSEECELRINNNKKLIDDYAKRKKVLPPNIKSNIIQDINRFLDKKFTEKANPVNIRITEEDFKEYLKYKTERGFTNENTLGELDFNTFMCDYKEIELEEKQYFVADFYNLTINNVDLSNIDLSNVRFHNTKFKNISCRSGGINIASTKIDGLTITTKGNTPIRINMFEVKDKKYKFPKNAKIIDKELVQYNATLKDIQEFKDATDKEGYKGNLNKFISEPEVGDEIYNVIIKDQTFRGIDFSGLNLSGCKFIDTKFIDCTFKNTKLYNTRFKKVEMINNTFDKDDAFKNSIFIESKFEKNKFTGKSVFLNAQISRSAFTGNTYSGYGNDFDGVNFNEALVIDATDDKVRAKIGLKPLSKEAKDTLKSQKYGFSFCSATGAAVLTAAFAGIVASWATAGAFAPVFYTVIAGAVVGGTTGYLTSDFIVDNFLVDSETGIVEGGFGNFLEKTGIKVQKTKDLVIKKGVELKDWVRKKATEFLPSTDKLIFTAVATFVVFGVATIGIGIPVVPALYFAAIPTAIVSYVGYDTVKDLIIHPKRILSYLKESVEGLFKSQEKVQQVDKKVETPLKGIKKNTYNKKVFVKKASIKKVVGPKSKKILDQRKRYTNIGPMVK